MFRNPKATVAFRLIIVVAIVCFFATRAAAVAPPSGAADAGSVGQPFHLAMMVVYAVVALTCSFLCSVAEAVVLSITPSFIASREQEGRTSAKLLKATKGNIDRSLAAILTLNTIAHTVGAGGAGAEAAAYFGPSYVGVTMAILTLLILFLSEIVPKTLGAVYWRRLATATAHFVRLLVLSLFPLIYVSELLTKLITRGKPVHAFSREEFTALAEIGAEHGHLDPKESRILRNLFRFPDLCAADIMTPRTVVFALQQDITVHEVLEKHPEISFTRIPVYGENRDDISGFVLKTDLLLNQSRGEGKAKLRDLRRDLPAIRGNMPLGQVLEELLNGRHHVLLAIDQYGGMEGLVTLEDVVETLIGMEIVDEADKAVDMRAVARQKWQERMKRIGIDVKASGEEE